jgi:hypothetical protein
LTRDAGRLAGNQLQTEVSMEKFWSTLSRQWQDAVNVVLGLWLIVSPWVLGYAMETTPAWNAYVLGVIIAVAAIAALVAFHAWEEWVSVVLGVWLVVSPWILGFAASATALWNQIVVGVIVAALAFWSAMATHERSARA